MTDVSKTIENFDFDTAQPHDVAVLLEQVFLYHDARFRDGGPIIMAQDVLQRYEAVIRRRAAPQLHMKVTGRCIELRSTLTQFDNLLRSLERDNAQTRT